MKYLFKFTHFPLILSIGILMNGCGGSSSNQESYIVTEITDGLIKSMERYSQPMSGFHNGLAVMADANHNYGLIDLQGNEVVECKYHDIDWVNGNFYTKKKKGDSYLYGLLDANGNEIIPCEYSWLWAYPGENVIVMGKYTDPWKKCYFVSDSLGKDIKELESFFAEQYIIPGGDVISSVFKGTNDSYNRCGFVTKKDAKRVEGRLYHTVGPFLGEYAAVYPWQSFGIVDKKGKLVYRMVNHDGKCGLENMTGEIIIPCEYDWIDGYDKGVVKITRNHLEGLYDIERGKEILPPVYEDIHTEKYSQVTMKPSTYDFFQSMMLFNRNFGMEREPRVAFNFDGLFFAKKGNYYEGFDCEGNLVIDKSSRYTNIRVWPAVDIIECKTPSYTDIRHLNGELRADGQKYNIHLPHSCDDGSVLFTTNNDYPYSYGILTKSDKILDDEEFDGIDEPSEGLIRVIYKNGEIAYLNSDGKKIIDGKNLKLTYSIKANFEGGLAPVAINYDDWGFLNIKGETTLNKKQIK